jgi:hypothetical protein
MGVYIRIYMRFSSTPFFSALGPLLFGRPPCPESACRDAVREAQAWWSLGRRRPISSNISAYCQAQTRLREKTLETIHRQTAQRLEGNVPPINLWLGRRVKIVDGTGCSMPDTAENQKASTLLDPIAFPAQALGELYFQRWSVELHFREIKTLLRLDVPRCLTPKMVHNELLLYMIAYNLIRCLRPLPNDAPVSTASSPITATVAALMGPCPTAGFAAEVYVAATMTNGYGRQSQYDAEALMGFVLTPLII